MPKLVVSTVTGRARRIIEVVEHLEAECPEVDCFLADSFTVPAFPSRLEDGLAEFSGFLCDGEAEGLKVLLAPFRDVLSGSIHERRTRSWRGTGDPL